MKHTRIGRKVLAGALALGLLIVASTMSVAAHGPVISHNTSFSYTLVQSLDDFAADPNEYEVDCGAFKVISTFDVTRNITTWDDREFRHIVFNGFYVNASDPSKTLPRNGDFERTTRFDANGDTISQTQRGVLIWTVLDGRGVNLVRASASTRPSPTTVWTGTRRWSADRTASRGPWWTSRRTHRRDVQPAWRSQLQAASTAAGPGVPRP